MKSFCLIRVFPAVLALLLAAAGTAAENRAVSITMTWQPQAQFAGIYYAKETGIFAKYGLDVEIRHKTVELSIVDYLTEKHSDFIVASLGTALVERSKGVPLVNVCQLGKESTVMLIAAAGNGIEKVEDLKRPAPSGEPRRFAVWEVDFGAVPLAFLRERKITGRIVPMNTGIALFLWGATDVICAMEYNEYYQLLAAGYEPDELVCFRLRDNRMNIPEDGLYTLELTEKADPGVCAALRKAILEGWREALRNPEQALAFVRKYCDRDNSRYDPAHQHWMFNVYGKSLALEGAPAGTLPKSDYDFAVLLFQRHGLIESAVDYSRFCPEAKEGGGK